MNLAIKGNSLYSIFVSPKETFHAIFNKRNQYMPLLYIVGCLWMVINKALQYNRETYFGSSFLVSFLIALATSWVLFYVSSVIINAIGNAVGERAKREKSRTVLLWSFAPGLIAIVMFVLAVLFFGIEVLKKDTAIGELSIIRIILLYINSLLGLWGGYILLKGTMLIHNISALKAMLTLLLPIIIYLTISFIL